MGENSSCCDNSDDLEITSIGDLYRGPWNKKYWSCSRGKDRYPYPVGYHAIRTHAGSTYRMEIHEGLNGPLFMVTFTDGESSSGQTPDIAWENFQKKSGPRVKNWHGKGLSCKVDGVEIFGFRNSFVQRLLRELVADVNGTAERALASSSFFTGASHFNSEIRKQKLHAFPDLPPYPRKQRTGKRSTQCRTYSRSFSEEARDKRICCQDLLNIGEGGDSDQTSKLSLHAKNNSPVRIQEKNLPILKDLCLASHGALHHLNNSPKDIVAAASKETLFQTDPQCHNDGHSEEDASSSKHFLKNQARETSSLHTRVSDVVEDDCHLLARAELLMGSEQLDCFAEEHIISNEQSKAACGKNCVLPCMEDVVSHDDKGPIDRLSDAEPEQGNDLVSPKDGVREIPVSESYSNVCVYDTFDDAKDGISTLALESNMGRLCSMNNDAVPTESMLRTATSSVMEVIPRSMPKEFISKNRIGSADVMHSIVSETCTPVGALSKELIKDSLQGVGSSSDSSNPSSEKIDLNLAGQELARSMMTFLLPRAVPLLKKTYVKRRQRNRNRETKCDPCSNFKNDHMTDCIHEGKLLAGALTCGSENKFSEQVIAPQKILGVDSLCEPTKVVPLVRSSRGNKPVIEAGSSKDVKLFVPDSFEDDQCLTDSTKRCLASSSAGANARPSSEIKKNIDTSKSFVNVTGGGKEPSPCVLENGGSIEVVELPEELDKGEYVLSDSLAACVLPDRLIHLVEKCKEELTDDEKISCPDHADIPSLHPSCVGQDSSLEFIGDSLCNAEEGTLHFEGIPVHTPLRSHKAEHSEQIPPTPCPGCEKLGDGEVPKNILTQSYCINGSLYKKIQNSSTHELINFDSPVIDFDDGNLRSQVCPRIPQAQLDGKAVVNAKGNSSFFCTLNVTPSTGGPSPQSFKEDNLQLLPHLYVKCTAPLSESIICRNLNENNAYISPMASPAAENGQARNESSTKIRIQIPNEVGVDKEIRMLDAIKNIPSLESVQFTVPPGVSEYRSSVRSIAEDINPSNFLDSSISYFEKNGMGALNEPMEWRKEFSDPCKNDASEVLSCSDKNLAMNSTSNNVCKNISDIQLCQKNQNILPTEEENSNKELGGHLELVGSYLHPDPVLSISLSSKEDCLQICVLCGHFDCLDRNLFIYKVPIKESKGRYPSFLGYTSLILPLLDDPFDGNISFGRYGMQLTPDGQSLVFCNNIKAPHCREQDINCLCSTCKFDCADGNAVKVAHVRFGYLSHTAKFTTNDRVSCILVCEPNYLLAAEETGRLKVWIMNCTWSGNLEEFMLPNFDYVSPIIVELKKLPKCDSLIVGHNGVGGFGLWDISKRSLLARFSTPGHMIFKIVPIRLFTQEHNKKTVLSLQMTNNWLPEFGENPFFLPSEDNIAVWLLVSAVSGSEVLHDKVKQPSTSPVGCWRLALLVKNMMVMGSILDPRASVLDASDNYGVIGTCEGLMYKWELSTGKKLASLHFFKCGCISGIALDAKSGALAVATNERRLMVYSQARKEC